MGEYFAMGWYASKKMVAWSIFTTQENAFFFINKHTLVSWTSMSVSISNKMDNMSKFLVQTTYLFILANDNLIGI